MFGFTAHEKAYAGPFFAFLAVGGAGAVTESLFPHSAHWALSQTRYWVCPMQALIGAAFLAHYWRLYEMRTPVRAWFAVLIGTVALLVWISPQQWFGLVPRRDGFDPAFFGREGWPYILNVGLRFVRLVVVVPLVEEIFWRGFLLRYFIDDDFTDVPIGAFSWLSFGVVTAGFCLEHSMPDWPAAIVTGMLFNAVAYYTRSLSACVLTHAVTNLLLGVYVMRTGQWGFW
jgi:CAAX prenyl protease-like protein